MIKLVTGVLGQGKTLFCVIEIFDLLCKGRTVATNVDLVWSELFDLAARVRGVELQESQLIRINPETDPDFHLVIPWGVPGCPIHVVLDEIHLFFNARDWAETLKTRRSLLKFLTQSRKAGVDVTFIAQDATTIEKQFRVFAEWEYRVVSTDHMPLGPLGKLPFKAFIVAIRDATQGHLIKRVWRSYDRRFFRIYKSFSFLDSEMQDLSEKVERRGPLKLARVGFRRRFVLFLKADFRPILEPLSRRFRPAS